MGFVVVVVEDGERDVWTRVNVYRADANNRRLNASPFFVTSLHFLSFPDRPVRNFLTLQFPEGVRFRTQPSTSGRPVCSRLLDSACNAFTIHSLHSSEDGRRIAISTCRVCVACLSWLAGLNAGGGFARWVG